MESVSLPEASGGGSLIDRDGHVLTNYHVIESGNRIDVYLPNGRATRARIVGTAPSMDLALLRATLTTSFDPLLRRASKECTTATFVGTWHEWTLTVELQSDDDAVEPLTLGDSKALEVGQ